MCGMGKTACRDWSVPVTMAASRTRRGRSTTRSVMNGKGGGGEWRGEVGGRGDEGYFFRVEGERGSGRFGVGRNGRWGVWGGCEGMYRCLGGGRY